MPAVSRPRFSFCPSRLFAAATPACVAVSFVIAAMAFRGNGHDMTDELKSAVSKAIDECKEQFKATRVAAAS